MGPNSHLLMVAPETRLALPGMVEQDCPDSPENNCENASPLMNLLDNPFRRTTAEGVEGRRQKDTVMFEMKLRSEAHRTDHHACKTKYFVLAFLPSLALGAATTILASSVSSDRWPAKDTIMSVLGVLSASCAAVAGYWNWQGDAEKHLNASKGFQNLYMKLRNIALDMDFNDKFVLKDFLTRMRDINQQAAEMRQDAPILSKSLSKGLEGAIEKQVKEADNLKQTIDTQIREARQMLHKQECEARQVEQQHEQAQQDLMKSLADTEQHVQREKEQMQEHAKNLSSRIQEFDKKLRMTEQDVERERKSASDAQMENEEMQQHAKEIEKKMGIEQKQQELSAELRTEQMKSALARSEGRAMEIEASMGRQVAKQQEQQAESAAMHTLQISSQMAEISSQMAEMQVLGSPGLGSANMRSVLTQAESREEEQKHLAQALQEEATAREVQTEAHLQIAAEKEADVDRMRSALRDALAVAVENDQIGEMLSRSLKISLDD